LGKADIAPGVEEKGQDEDYHNDGAALERDDRRNWGSLNIVGWLGIGFS
jgi:hypothetical protein